MLRTCIQNGKVTACAKKDLNPSGTYDTCSYVFFVIYFWGISSYCQWCSIQISSDIAIAHNYQICIESAVLNHNVR